MTGKIRQIFGKTSVPQQEDPKVAPDPDDDLARANLERKARRKQQGRGRSGTALQTDSQLG